MHSFHIPVLGLGFSIDTPLKVARYGISSVVSIVDDELIERMRAFHCLQNQLDYNPIKNGEADYRARRIQAYLDVLDVVVNQQFEVLKGQEPGQGNDIDRYFAMLPDDSDLKQLYHEVVNCDYDVQRSVLLRQLRSRMEPGRIDVNIMSKLDKVNYDKHGDALDERYTDALAALRGFANSTVNSAVILSAGMNPRLYSYLEQFPCFMPDANGDIQKKIILKVSDYRSALVQAKFLAKKGLWVYEFRVESGLNCGGHAFATDGLLLGPILEEFKQKRQEMFTELQQIYLAALAAKGYDVINNPTIRVTAQGGIGTAEEDAFLRNHYELDGTGWGSPFLLVPEATNVDNATLEKLITAEQTDFYVSAASPLGVLFNNFKKSSMEQLRLERIARDRPGSPCTKKYLCTNTEFTDKPICTASREYQHKKIMELQAEGLTPAEYQRRLNEVLEKCCLCEGLATPAYIKNDLLKPRESKAVAICPGPNLAYFSGTYALDEMVDHIYGRINLLHTVMRPHVFINELDLYIDYLAKEIQRDNGFGDTRREKYLSKFAAQLQQGIKYYTDLLTVLFADNETARATMDTALVRAGSRLYALMPEALA